MKKHLLASLSVSAFALPQDNAASQGFDDAARLIYTLEKGAERSGVSRIS